MRIVCIWGGDLEGVTTIVPHRSFDCTSSAMTPESEMNVYQNDPSGYWRGYLFLWTLYHMFYLVFRIKSFQVLNVFFVSWY